MRFLEDTFAAAADRFADMMAYASLRSFAAGFAVGAFIVWVL